MSIKGGEAALLLRFILWELENLGGIQIFGAALVGAVVSLQTILDKRRNVLGKTDHVTMRALRSQVAVHIRCCRRAGISLIPKSHQLLHLIDRSLRVNRGFDSQMQKGGEYNVGAQIEQVGSSDVLDITSDPSWPPVGSRIRRNP